MRYFLVAICLFLYTGVGWSQDKVKIGFIDIQRAISESQSGKRAKERFQAQVKKAEADLLKEKAEIERLKTDLDKKGPLLKDEEISKRTCRGAMSTTNGGCRISSRTSDKKRVR
jgi:Skp family chaperone for outer membrane proteins